YKIYVMTLWEGRVRSLVERREIRDEDFHVEKRFSYGSKVSKKPREERVFTMVLKSPKHGVTICSPFLEVERMQLLSLNMRLAVAIPQHEVTICSLFSEEERMRADRHFWASPLSWKATLGGVSFAGKRNTKIVFKEASSYPSNEEIFRRPFDMEGAIRDEREDSLGRWMYFWRGVPLSCIGAGFSIPYRPSSHPKKAAVKQVSREVLKPDTSIPSEQEHEEEWKLMEEAGAKAQSITRRRMEAKREKCRAEDGSSRSLGRGSAGGGREGRTEPPFSLKCGEG
ncbi:hypothetical protein ACLOJK_037109, partial [Asimina triloba]